MKDRFLNWPWTDEESEAAIEVLRRRQRAIEALPETPGTAALVTAIRDVIEALP
jgi:hypothetical protein